MWGKFCERTFSRLQADVARQVNDADLLPHVPAVLSWAEFEVAIQGTGRPDTILYQKIGQRHAFRRAGWLGWFERNC